jgi:pantetheine-phosphate adenylyltransferase
MKTGLFPGTFDPPSLGHLDLIQRASRLCDRLIVAVAQHPKKQPLFSTQERIHMLQLITKNVEITQFHGLAVDFAQQQNTAFLIRGLRSLADFEYEFQMAEANRRLSGIETIFLMGQPHISSSLIREIGSYGGSLKDFVPAEIESLIRQKLRVERLSTN